MNDLKEFVSEIVICKKKIYDHNYLLTYHYSVANQLWINLIGIFMYLKIDILK